MKFGVRCKAKSQQELHSIICPNKPFVQCNVREIYRLEPLPVGTQRQSLMDLLKSFNWTAKPLQPCKGSMGRAWEVGAESAPNDAFLEAQHGWITVTKVRDAAPPPKAQELIATAKTKQHIQNLRSSETSTASASSDPWLSKQADPWSNPWSNYKGTTPANVPASQHVQQKFDDVERRLQQEVQAAVSQEVAQMQVDNDQSDRLTAVEQQLQSLSDHQRKIEVWATESNTKVAAVQQDCQQLHEAVKLCHAQVQSQDQTLKGVQATMTQQGTAIQTVAKEVTGLKDNLQVSLESYFNRQTSEIEALLSKRHRTEWLGHTGPSARFWRVPVIPNSFGFLRRFWFIFVFLSQLMRIGEATVPGPFDLHSDVDSFIDPPRWFLPGTPDFCVGIGNPAGISNKLHMLEYFPKGWFHLAETQASQRQQCAFQSRLRSLSYNTGRNLRSSLGAPAALRSGSSHAGSWTGVLSFGDCPLRSIPCLWPNGEFASGRVLLTAARLGSLDVAAATVYLPPVGPSYPKARQLSEELLAPITENLVYGRQGPRMILGDFNSTAGSLRNMQLWQSQGWIEVQNLFADTHFRTPEMTCKGATAPDQIWISPEMIPFIRNISTWDVFPDHKMLLIGLNIGSSPAFHHHWALPGHIPWNHLDQDSWKSQPELPCLVPTNFVPEGGSTLSDCNSLPLPFDSTKAFHEWSHAFEKRASACVPGIGRLDRSFHGRGKLTQPIKRRSSHAVPKASRPEEIEQASGFLNRAVARWFKQLRRLQSYCHAVRSARSDDNFLSRSLLWQSIKHAPGFEDGFFAWWGRRAIQLQGSPDFLLDFPPGLDLANQIYEDFSHNYRRFEHWQLRRRQDSCKSKVLTSSKLLFIATRKPAKAPIDTLEDCVSQTIEVVDFPSGQVSVPEPFPDTGVTHWLHQGQPAIVKKIDDTTFELDSDILIMDGQTLACHTMVHEAEVIHDRLAQLWTSRWNKHQDTPPETWSVICQFARQHLPSGDFELPALTLGDWKAAVHKFKLTAATGPCGWTRSDLVNMTDTQISQVLGLFEAIEKGADWPKQWQVGLIHCLEKKEGVKDVNGFRPINVMSLFYRVYSGLRAGQLLSRLAQWADHMQCGFLKNRQASDIWYYVGVCLEVSFQQNQPVHGLVADLVKAYNTLPRFPTFEFMKWLGFPPWLLDMWQRHLSGLARHFLVRQTTGPPLSSTTGYPEGCPLSCVAMTVVDTVWHLFQRIAQPRVATLSYVDNLECLADSVPLLTASLSSLRSFCSVMDLELDEKALYLWSSDPVSRQELRSQGFQVCLGGRDLGGQVTYCKQLRNRVLVDRIETCLPFFSSLRQASLPQAVKKSNILQVLLPRALHGVEATELGDGHIHKLRTGVMKALHWDAPGASPISRVTLCHMHLDPGWYQLRHVVEQFRRQCIQNATVWDWWRIFCTARVSQQSHGPFTKLLNQLHNVGLNVDENLALWFSERGKIDLHSCTQHELELVLGFHYRKQQTALLAPRQGFAGLDGFDLDLTTWVDRHLSVSDLALVHKVRDGSFISKHAQSRFDTSKTGDCDWCQVRDDREHKYTVCSKYDDIRAGYADLFEHWDGLPACFKLQGLVPANPWTTLLWEAFQALPDMTETFAFPPEGHTWHVFTDGTCSSPTCGAESQAAWGVVLAGKGTVSAGPLQGIQQNILRAEIVAIISALKWSHRSPGDLHLWVDNMTAVQHLRELLTHTASPQDFEHIDLWQTVQVLLGSTTADVYVHKVSSHEHETDSTSPLGDFCRKWNDKADQQAALANIQRPLWFEKVWTGYMNFRNHWKALVARHNAFVLAVAKQDCAKDSPSHADERDLEQVSPLVFDRISNDAQVSVQLAAMQGHIEFSSGQDALFRNTVNRVCDFVVSQDQTASMSRLVSLLEIYVGVRINGDSRGPLSVGGPYGSYNVVTFASDFSYFKKAFRFLFEQAGLSRCQGHLSLSGISIFAPLPAVQIGWLSQTERAVCDALVDFVGQRPIYTAQGLARPWNP